MFNKTRNNQNSRETRKQFIWFFSGEGGSKEYTAGVGIVVSNKFMQYVEDVEPISGRLMYITIRGTLETNIICTYMPPADRPDEEKDKAYDKLQQTIDNKNTKDHYTYGGDFNARLLFQKAEAEESILGEHTHTHYTKPVKR